MAGRVRRVPERYGVRGKVWYGRQGVVRLYWVSHGLLGIGLAGMAVLGALCFGKSRFVEARHGRSGKAGQVRSRIGAAWYDEARTDKAGTCKQ